MNPGGVVVNAGPLIALDSIGQLELLVRLSEQVMVPATVVQELA
jgi:predicted nucleic acid-binding protein